MVIARVVVGVSAHECLSYARLSVACSGTLQKCAARIEKRPAKPGRHEGEEQSTGLKIGHYFGIRLGYFLFGMNGVDSV